MFRWSVRQLIWRNENELSYEANERGRLIALILGWWKFKRALFLPVRWIFRCVFRVTDEEHENARDGGQSRADVVTRFARGQRSVVKESRQWNRYQNRNGFGSLDETYRRRPITRKWRKSESEKANEFTHPTLVWKTSPSLVRERAFSMNLWRGGETDRTPTQRVDDNVDTHIDNRLNLSRRPTWRYTAYGNRLISWRRRRLKWKLRRHSPDKHIDERFESFGYSLLGTFCLSTIRLRRCRQRATVLRMFEEELSPACRSRLESHRVTERNWTDERFMEKIETHQKEDGRVNAESSDGSENAQHSDSGRSERGEVEEGWLRRLNMRLFLLHLK